MPAYIDFRTVLKRLDFKLVRSKPVSLRIICTGVEKYVSVKNKDILLKGRIYGRG
jgi:hypothetical protein